MSSVSEMAEIISRHATGSAMARTAVDSLWLIRADQPTVPIPTVYNASLCVIVQGAKSVALGERTLVYDPSNYLIVSVDLPLVGHVIEASEDVPYLCCKIDLDHAVLTDLLIEDDNPLPSGDPPPLALHPSDPGLFDAVCRLLRLLDSPDSIRTLAPLVEREILYRLLKGPHGAMLRHVASGDSHLGRISRAIACIREHYREQLRIAAVASAAGMSLSSLHAHFKAVTGMTPLQYQKQLRLQEARRLMIAEGVNAGSAGFAVGYDSPSQFSREYRRLFGASPRQHVEQLQDAGEAIAA